MPDGVALYTAFAFTEWSALLLMLGTGPFTVVAGEYCSSSSHRREDGRVSLVVTSLVVMSTTTTPGVQVCTGVINIEALAVGAQFGEWPFPSMLTLRRHCGLY